MRLNDSVAVRPHLCPYCAHRLDSAAGVDDAVRPEPGDATICIDCGEPLIFAADMTVRKPDADEKRLLDADDGVQYLRQTIAEMHRSQGRRIQ